MTAVPAEQSRAGYTLLTLRAAGAHLGFGAFALSRSLLWPSSTCAHSTFFTNYHTTDLHVSYSDVQGEITVLIAYLSCLTSCSESGWRRRTSVLRNAGIRMQNNHKTFEFWVHRQGTICFIATTLYDQNLCKSRLLEMHRFLFFNVLQRGNSSSFLV